MMSNVPFRVASEPTPPPTSNLTGSLKNVPDSSNSFFVESLFQITYAKPHKANNPLHHWNTEFNACV